MTIHTYPGGVTATHPDSLDTAPPVHEQLASVMNRAIDQLDTPASFIPAVHDPRRDAVIEAAHDLRRLMTDEIQPTPREFWPTVKRLCDAVDAMGGAA
ncbi:hypothetical protein [Cellulomonas denverensis]|uniref:Uncharacterized protein n=1 Tax=Cellulomonas denverensis TaxID=264297 RepID=A0A7X6KUD8_9CELL|nr:hypothetical protein [Cellulomonas denverensis]NKY22183.1 hypothetical protein [Cellulomonas denverensis]GIG27146.1 hypothetical protein Cde04nite_33900 [Cellulomonas denverensis]